MRLVNIRSLVYDNYSSSDISHLYIRVSMFVANWDQQNDHELQNLFSL